MITIPVYELLLLPEVTFFFKKDMFPEGRIKEQNIGEEILFVLQKKEIAPEEISMENIFPVGYDQKEYIRFSQPILNKELGKRKQAVICLLPL